MPNENVLSLFLEKERELQTAPCFQYKSKKKWKTLNWIEVKEKIAKLSSALEKLGVKAGDKVAILSNTRYEWTIADLAILSLGAVTVPIYQSTLPKDVQYILEHSESKIVFVENRSQLKKVEDIRSKISSLKTVISIESIGEEVLSLKKMIEAEKVEEDFLKNKAAHLNLDSLATIVYTSGTTGQPKGVCITHSNLVSEVEGLKDVFRFPSDAIGLFFLPLAHILARAVQFFQLGKGVVHAYAESIDKLIDNIQEVRPHFMVCVPRIFEKIYTKIMNDVSHSNFIKRSLFHWALEIGTKVGRAKQSHHSISSLDSIQYEIAKRLVFSKLHKRLGGRVRFFISGGAPLSAEIAEFFHAAGILILEGYGLTETLAGTNCNREDNYRFGTVGLPIRGIQEKIASDGEVLIKGPPVFKEYYKNEEATKQAFTDDGFFKTGDIGEIDSDGFLKITDRKKDLIVTAAGKNVAPQYIENLLKTDPLISNVMVHGDRRKFLSALITLNPEELLKFAESHEIKNGNYGELIKNSKVLNLLHKRIEEKNKQLASFETIKRFAVLPQDFTVEGGELTPTLKVKRKLVTERYKTILDSFYKE